jgi:hypothetical protein
MTGLRLAMSGRVHMARGVMPMTARTARIRTAFAEGEGPLRFGMIVMAALEG